MVTPDALTFSATCSGRDAPTSAAATLSFCSTHATASCAIDRSSSAATGLRFCTAVSVSSFMKRLIVCAPPFSSVAREPAGAGCPGRYLPESTPCAMGDHTIWETPASFEAGTTSSSMTRHSIEYWGCEEISWKPSCLASAAPSRIWSAVHSETPM